MDICLPGCSENWQRKGQELLEAQTKFAYEIYVDSPVPVGYLNERLRRHTVVIPCGGKVDNDRSEPYVEERVPLRRVEELRFFGIERGSGEGADETRYATRFGPFCTVRCLGVEDVAARGDEHVDEAGR